MKRTFVLLTLVAALVAAPAFAETTFTGSVEYHMGTDFDSYDYGTDNGTSISLDGTVGEFTTISVGISGDDDSDVSNSIMTLSQDVTGALGMDGAVSFAYTVGKQTYTPKDYSAVAGYEDQGADAKIGQGWTADDTIYRVTTESLIGAVLKFGIMDMINLDVAVYPGTYTEASKSGADVVVLAGATALGEDYLPEFGINAYGTFGMIDASVYYVMSPQSSFIDDDEDDTDTNGNMFGINLGGTYDALKFGFIYEADLEQDTVNVDGSGNVTTTTTILQNDLGLAVQYSLGALTPGASIKTSFNADTESIAEETKLGLNLTYDATEAVSLWGAAASELATADGEEFSDIFCYEVGVSAALDGVTYSLGYTSGSEFKAYTDSDTFEDGNMFFCVNASF